MQRTLDARYIERAIARLAWRQAGYAGKKFIELPHHVQDSVIAEAFKIQESETFAHTNFKET